MSLFSKVGIVLLSIALCGVALPYGDEKDKGHFKPRAAPSYSSHQTNEKVTIGIEAFDSDELAHSAFGKLNPHQHEVLPVLVVIQNDSGQALRVENLAVRYVDANGSKVDPTPPGDVPYISGPQRPNMTGTPSPLPRLKKKKNPFNVWEIQGRAFSAKMVLPGESASGFFYFQTRHRTDSKLYVTGIREASSGKELFYFDIPFVKSSSSQ